MDEEIKEEIRNTIHTRGWGILKKYFYSKKEEYKNLNMDCDLDTDEGINNAKKFQAMYHSIDSFYEMVNDLIKREESEENI